jgi:uncharacterized protein (DUF2249 family)
MEHTLDVSMLEPCEPLERTLAAIQELEGGDYLRVIHRREPQLLYPLLEKSGYAWCIRPGGASRFEIFIWRENDGAAEEAVSLRMA